MSTQYDPEMVALISTQLTRTRATLQRQRLTNKRTQEHQKHLIRDGLEYGMTPKQIARLAGMTTARVSQIRNEGGPKVTAFDFDEMEYGPIDG